MGCTRRGTGHHARVNQLPRIDWRQQVRLQGVTLGVILVVLWSLELADVMLRHLFPPGLDRFGIFPRQIQGLPGVLLAPLLHVNFQHLAANTLPLLVLASLMLVEGARRFWKALVIIVLVSGVIVWLFGAAGSVYLGSSNVVYGCFGFLLMRAWITRRPAWVAVGVVVLLLYGGLGSALFTLKEGVSWLGHTAGLLAGMVAADQMHRCRGANAKTCSQSLTTQ